MQEASKQLDVYVSKSLFEVSFGFKLNLETMKLGGEANSEYVRSEYHKPAAVKRPRRGSPTTSSIANYVILEWGDGLWRMETYQWSC